MSAEPARQMSAAASIAQGLKEGDYLSPSFCERLITVDRENRMYGIQLLELQCEIEKECKAIGKNIALCIQGDGIKALTSAEAVDYLTSRRESMVAGIRRMNKKLTTCVDIRKLSPEEHVLYVRSVTIGASQIAAMKQARKLVNIGTSTLKPASR